MTFLYVAIFVPFIIAVSLAGAVLLDKLVRFTGTFRALLFIPYLSSFVMAGIIWTWIFSTEGPLNAALVGLGMGPVPFTSGPQLLVLLSLAVVSVWKGFGYSMLIFLAGSKHNRPKSTRLRVLTGGPALGNRSGTSRCPC